LRYAALILQGTRFQMCLMENQATRYLALQLTELLEENSSLLAALDLMAQEFQRVRRAPISLPIPELVRQKIIRIMTLFGAHSRKREINEIIGRYRNIPQHILNSLNPMASHASGSAGPSTSDQPFQQQANNQEQQAKDQQQ